MQKKLKGEEMRLKHYILMSKIFYTICLFFLCTAFRYHEPNYCKMVDRITKNYLRECTKPNRLMLSGYGGAMMNDIQSVTLHFLSHDSLSVDEARILYVEMMEEYLQRINCHEKIRPHLHDFPFSIDNIKLDISFIDSECHTRKDGNVAMIFIGRNHVIHYDAYDSVKKFYSLHREPYEEALKLVRESSNLDSNH